MSWLSSIAVAILTAAAGCVASGFVASLSVSWYKISGREGNSGYYVIAIALCGLLGGLIIGLIASRIIAAGTNPGFLKALAVSAGITLAIVTMVAVPARLLADVAPTVDGETLMLVVEARWPTAQTESPATAPGVSYLELGSLTSGRVQRIAERGPLWKEDAHVVDGRWTVTGAVPVFTERGKRVVNIALNDSTHAAFIAKLPARPTVKDFAWSDWFPTGAGAPVTPDGISYRFRVQKASLPVRTEHFGNFAVSMIPQYFQQTSAPGTTTLEPWASNFEITYKGHPARMPDGSLSSLKFNGGMVALLPNTNVTLLASSVLPDPENGCAILTDDNGTLRLTPVGPCSSGIQAEEVTSESSHFPQVKKASLARGHVDQLTYANAKTLAFGQALLDVDQLHLTRFTATIDRSRLSYIPSVPPLGISPDARTFVRFALTNGSENSPVLIVIDALANTVTELPVDRARLRYGNLDDLSAGWLSHHFEWQRGTDGGDKLVERKSFTPMPYHGNTSVEGERQEYYKVDQGGRIVRMALVEMLEKDFGATRDTIRDTGYSYALLVKGVRVNASTNGEPSDYVMMSLDYGEPPSTLVGELGKAFDAVLATGKYDAALTPPVKK
jgi:hypothetical protein